MTVIKTIATDGRLNAFVAGLLFISAFVEAGQNQWVLFTFYLIFAFINGIFALFPPSRITGLSED